ncbi:MAG: HYR domain-containing protein [Flavobacteriales bacterium]|nr:HYR domain-containing protein [Flavobacteriales bacterium]
MNTNSGCTATGVALGTPVSSDNCAVATVTNDAPAVFPIGVTTVTWTLTDNAGSTATCTQTVTVSDATAPSADCQNITVQLDASGSATITPASIDGGSSDNCSGFTLSASQTVFNCSHIGVNTVTLTVTDASGNVGTCDAIVTVEDTIDPTITCPGDQTVQLAFGSTGTWYVPVINANDNCGISAIAPAVTDSLWLTAGTHAPSLTA